MIQKLRDFISTERNRFEDNHNNMFVRSFSEITRYYDFLKIILERYKTASKSLIDNTKDLHASIAHDNSNKLSEKQYTLLSRNYGLSLNVHLEIESFYLFAKVLLDKIALSIQFYFGEPERKLSLASHDKLTKHIEAYARARSLYISQGFVDIVKKLKEDIADYRDYQIQHIHIHRYPRLVRGTIYDDEGNTRLSVNTLYPKHGDKQCDSKYLHELLSEVESYIEKLIIFIEQNKVKTWLTLLDTES